MMPLVVWLCIGWVFASVGVACLPIGKQFVPAGILLLVAPLLIVMIGFQFGWIFALLGLAAFVSMFRNPLRYLAARLRGENPELPK